MPAALKNTLLVEIGQALVAQQPFILAGHSQGSLHGARLLRERVAGTPLSDRLGRRRSPRV